MQNELELNFRDIESTPAIEDKIHKGVQKLEQISDRRVSCHIVVEQVQKHKHKGKLYTLNIVLTVPGQVLVVNKHRDEDVYAAIRDSFSSMQRILEAWHQRQHGEVKHHPEPMEGIIARLIGEDGYGFVRDASGNDFYFTGGNLHNASFADLKEGERVHFIIAQGDEGAQAHRVTVLKG